MASPRRAAICNANMDTAKSVPVIEYDAMDYDRNSEHSARLSSPAS